MRLEQLYPFPEKTLGAGAGALRNADVVWCQEEPENMGAWNFVDRRIEKVLGRLESKARRPRYVGRDAAASPATGSARMHAARAGGAGRCRARDRAEMATEIKVPTLGESVTSATVARWMKHAGDAVAADEPLVELETDKVTVEVTAPSAGVLTSISAPEGSEVPVGALLGLLDGAATGRLPHRPGQGQLPSRRRRRRQRACGQSAGRRESAAAPRSGRWRGRRRRPPMSPRMQPLPAAAKLIEEQHLSAEQIGAGTGKDGRITKGDVLAFLNRPAPAPRRPRSPEPPRDDGAARRARADDAAAPHHRRAAEGGAEHRGDADHLQRGGHVGGDGAAHASTATRSRRSTTACGSGFMSFFVKACVAALKEFPAVNAEIDGDDIVYKNFVHMGIAVGGPAGLVVPVIRDVDAMSFAEIERAIADFGRRARDGALKLEELTGGTFSITNGGVYGSLMSTPILNPPQSGIPGHAQDPGAADGGRRQDRGHGR